MYRSPKMNRVKLTTLDGNSFRVPWDFISTVDSVSGGSKVRADLPGQKFTAVVQESRAEIMERIEEAKRRDEEDKRLDDFIRLARIYRVRRWQFFRAEKHWWKVHNGPRAMLYTDKDRSDSEAVYGAARDNYSRAGERLSAAVFSIRMDTAFSVRAGD